MAESGRLGFDPALRGAFLRLWGQEGEPDPSRRVWIGPREEAQPWPAPFTNVRTAHTSGQVLVYAHGKRVVELHAEETNMLGNAGGVLTLRGVRKFPDRSWLLLRAAGERGEHQHGSIKLYGAVRSTSGQTRIAYIGAAGTEEDLDALRGEIRLYAAEPQLPPWSGTDPIDPVAYWTARLWSAADVEEADIGLGVDRRRHFYHRGWLTLYDTHYDRTLRAAQAGGYPESDQRSDAKVNLGIDGSGTGTLRLYSYGGDPGPEETRPVVWIDGGDPRGRQRDSRRRSKRGRILLYDTTVEEPKVQMSTNDRGGYIQLEGQPAEHAILGNDDQGGFLDLRQRERSVRISSYGIFVRPMKDEAWTYNFVAEHPDPTKEIYYAVLEGPEVGVYARGTAQLLEGSATVPLPDHFAQVASPLGLTVQLTPRSALSNGVAATEVTTERLVLRELAGGAGSYAVDYFVQGVRRGGEGYEVVRPARPRPADCLRPSDKEAE